MAPLVVTRERYTRHPGDPVSGPSSNTGHARVHPFTCIHMSCWCCRLESSDAVCSAPCPTGEPDSVCSIHVLPWLMAKPPTSLLDLFPTSTPGTQDFLLQFSPGRDLPPLEEDSSPSAPCPNTLSALSFSFQMADHSFQYEASPPAER